MGSTRQTGVGVTALCVIAVLALTGLHSFAAAGSTDDADLPELPGVADRFEGLYDADGCLRTARDSRDCSVTAGELDESLAGVGVESVRHLSGFTGSRWRDGDLSGQPVVLEDTVTLEVGEAVEVRGLVRNEATAVVGAIEVTATVRGPGGEERAVLSGPAMVGAVRPGEPVPFVLQGPGVVGPVDHVEWRAEAVAGEPLSRELEWQAYWEQPSGSRDPVGNYLYTESGPGPHPHVAFGSVRNIGNGPVSGVAVVTAWLDHDGQVAAVGETSIVGPDGAAQGALAAGGLADALLVEAVVPVGAEAVTWVSAV